MKDFTLKKIFILVFTLIVVFFANTMSVSASDYKYKVLDPRYNPAAESLLKGDLQQLDESPEYRYRADFDFVQFFAILAAMLLPWILFSFAVKTFKRVMDVGFKTDREIYNQAFGNISETDSEQNNSESATSEISEKSEIKKDIENFIKENEIIETVEVKLNEVDEKVANNVVDFSDLALGKNSSRVGSESLSSKLMVDAIAKNKEVISNNINEFLVSYANSEKEHANSKIESSVSTSTINKQIPSLLNTAPLTKSKGLCLVQYGTKYSLIGYVGKKVFLIRQFDKLETMEIRPRLTETKENMDKYIVRLGSYKAMVSVTDRDIKLLLEL